jgi:hypothetical protein
MKYEIEVTKKKTVDLKNNLNPLHKKIFQAIPEHFIKEKLRYDVYERVTIGDDGTVLSFPEEVTAAYTNKVEELDVLQIKGLDKDEALRFMALHMFFRKLEHRDRIALIEEYTSHLKENPKGKEWAKELEEEGCTEMNDKLALIFNVSKDLIKHIKKQDSALPKIEDNPVVELSAADFEIKFFDGKIRYKGKELEHDESKVSWKTKGKKLIIEIDLSSEL